MANPFLYRCPTTGLLVQGVLNAADEPIPAGGEVGYQLVDCTACGQPHMVNPADERAPRMGR